MVEDVNLRTEYEAADSFAAPDFLVTRLIHAFQNAYLFTRRLLRLTRKRPTTQPPKDRLP